MGTRQLRILPYTGKRAYQYYIDGLKVNAKRQRLFLKDEKSAKAKLKELTNKTRKEGEDALALSHDFRVLAAKYSERLNPVTSVDKVKLVDKAPKFLGRSNWRICWRAQVLPCSRPSRYKRSPDYGQQGAAPGMVGRRSRPRIRHRRGS